jgi:hypothetical protein
MNNERVTAHKYALATTADNSVALARYDVVEDGHSRWLVLGALTQHRPHTLANIGELERTAQQLNEA